MAMRSAILRHIRVPVRSQALSGFKSREWNLSGGSLLRFMSSHDEHLTKEEVMERVLSVVKSFPKVDPSTVRCVWLHPLRLRNSICFSEMWNVWRPLIFLMGNCCQISSLVIDNAIGRLVFVVDLLLTMLGLSWFFQSAVAWNPSFNFI